MKREQGTLDDLNRTRFYLKSMVNDISIDWGKNQTISTMNTPRDVIGDNDCKKGHIVLEEDNFSINEQEQFEGEEIQSDDDLKPVVMKGKSTRGATIKGSGSLCQN